MSGRIVRVGEGVRDWSPGHAVTVIPLRPDGTCPACQAGHSRVCQNLNFVGIDSPGAMQQRWTLPASTLVRLPETLPLEQAALVEPTAVAVHDVGRAGVRAAERVVVVGGGPVGVLIASFFPTRLSTGCLSRTSTGPPATPPEAGRRRSSPHQTASLTLLQHIGLDLNPNPRTRPAASAQMAVVSIEYPVGGAWWRVTTGGHGRDSDNLGRRTRSRQNPFHRDHERPQVSGLFDMDRSAWSPAGGTE
jgi:hypothetical protein